MAKGKKTCHFCGCGLTNQNRTSIAKRGNWWGELIWLPCCHSCKHKEEKKS